MSINVAAWPHHRLLEVFGGGWGRRVTTEDELDDALACARARNQVDRPDTSEALKRLGAEICGY